MNKASKTANEIASAWTILVETSEIASHSGEGGYGSSETKSKYYPVESEQVIFENDKAIGIRAFDHDFLFSSWDKPYHKNIDSWYDDEMDYRVFSDTYLIPLVYDTDDLCANAEALDWVSYTVRQNITSVFIRGNVTTVGDECFTRCPKVTDVVLDKGVTSIGKRAFAECPNLINVSLPASLSDIGKNAFAACPSLKSITVAEDSPYYYIKNGHLYDRRTQEHVVYV